MVGVHTHSSVLSWSAMFNGEALQQAFDLNATLVLVHSDGRRKEPPLFAPASRMLDPFPTGSLLLGDGDAVGSFWQAGQRSVRFRRLVVLGDTIDTWRADPPPPRAR